MLEAFGNDAQGKGLDSRNGFVAIGAIGKDSWQGRNLTQPSAVVLTLEFD